MVVNCDGNLVLGGPCRECGMPRHPGACVTRINVAEVLAKAQVQAPAAPQRTEPEDGYPPGTWLRWIAGGQIKIGVVQYVRPEKYESTAGRWDYLTDAGPVSSNAILEAR